MITTIIANVIKVTLPPERWYKTAFLLTKYYAKVHKAPEGSYIRERYGNSFRMNHALKLEAVLTELAFNRKPCAVFPIPVKARGVALENLKKEANKGLMLCTIHTPLNLAGTRNIVEQGVMPDGIVGRYPPAEGYYTITGTTIQIPAIPVDRSVLIKVRTILSQGGTVVALVDNLSDGSFSPNIFRLAQKMNAVIMLVLVELLPDGTIRNLLIEAPNSGLTGEEALESTVKYLNDQALNYLAAIE